ncbi:MAG: hypothetical protein RLZZ352_2058 [Pseudomonadota bacterium]
MNISRIVFLVFSIISFEALGADCEKWKSEIASVSWALGGYIKAYSDYSTKKDDVMHHQLMKKSKDVLAKLAEAQGRAMSISSCPSPEGKYERRRNLLLQTINVASPTISASRYLAPAIKEAVDREHE